jgi:hypothetical protein
MKHCMIQRYAVSKKGDMKNDSIHEMPNGYALFDTVKKVKCLYLYWTTINNDG